MLVYQLFNEINAWNFHFVPLLFVAIFMGCSLQLFHQSLRRVGVHLTLRLHRVPRSGIVGGSGLLGAIFAGRSSLSNVSAG
jgi:hypothetical protein